MFGGFGRPQPSSAEKIAAAEAEMDLVTDMFNKYFLLPSSPHLCLRKALIERHKDSNKRA